MTQVLRREDGPRSHNADAGARLHVAHLVHAAEVRPQRNVRYGSKADITEFVDIVRFVP